MLREPVTKEWIENRLDILYPTHAEAFLRLLTVLRTLFDGDLDAMLVLAATSVSLRGEGWREALFEGQALHGQGNPTNTQSIAHITQVPRETVRRKLIWLQEKGWVRRDEQGNWLPSRQAASDLEPGTLATVNYLRVILNAALRSDQTGAMIAPKTK
jgi:DNA-binding transcriptional ArsR family regulator